MGNFLKEIWRKYYKIIILFLIVKVALLLTIIVLKPFLFENQMFYISNYIYSLSENSLLRSLSYYDGQIYLHIAHLGYISDIQFPHNQFFAFYPLYPLLMRFFSYLTFNSYYASGLLITLVASFLSTVYLYELFKLDTDERASLWGILFYLIFPAAIVYSALYTEALFMLFAVLSIYKARKEQWWQSGLFGMLATLTRAQGILIFIPLLIEYLAYFNKHQFRFVSLDYLKKTGFNILALALIPLGQALYFFYALITKGNFLLSMEVQGYWRRRPIGLYNLFLVFKTRIVHFASLPIHDVHYSKLDLLLTLAAIACLFFMYRRIRFSYICYSIFLIMMPLSTGTTMSMVRFLSLSFPHFLYLGKLSRQKHYVGIILLAIFLPILLFLTLNFINGYWLG